MDIVLAMERSLTTARSEPFLRERLRELEASELALAQALSLSTSGTECRRISTRMYAWRRTCPYRRSSAARAS